MTTATDINTASSKRRQTAAEGNASVAQLEQERKRTESLIELIEEKVLEMDAIEKDREILADEKAALKARAKALNDRAKAIYEDVEAEGVQRKAFQDTYAQRKRTEAERIKYESGRRLCWTAMGLETGEQLDFVKVLEAEMAELAAREEADVH